MILQIFDFQTGLGVYVKKKWSSQSTWVQIGAKNRPVRRPRTGQAPKTDLAGRIRSIQKAQAAPSTSLLSAQALSSAKTGA